MTLEYKIASGAYCFFIIDYKTKKTILITGSTKKQEQRRNEYRVSNSNISFDYWKPCPKNKLSVEERALQKYCRDNGLKQWGNSREQFVIDDMTHAENILQEYFGNPYHYRPNKNVDYQYGTVFGTADCRDNRERCFYITKDIAMILTKAGPYEKTRTVKINYKLSKVNRKIDKLPNPISFPVGQEAWDIIRVSIKNRDHQWYEKIKDLKTFAPENVIYYLDKLLENEQRKFK